MNKTPTWYRKILRKLQSATKKETTVSILTDRYCRSLSRGTTTTLGSISRGEERGGATLQHLFMVVGETREKNALPFPHAPRKKLETRTEKKKRQLKAIHDTSTNTSGVTQLCFFFLQMFRVPNARRMHAHSGQVSPLPGVANFANPTEQKGRNSRPTILLISTTTTTVGDGESRTQHSALGSGTPPEFPPAAGFKVPPPPPRAVVPLRPVGNRTC